MRRCGRVLITGAAGFVGKALSNRLVELGYDVHAFVRVSSDEAKLMSVECPHTTVHEVSNDFECIDKKIKDIMPNCVVHLATCFTVGTSGRDIKPLIDSNVLFGSMLIHSMIENGIENFVNTGSFWQHYQNTEYNPVNVYAATKQAFYDILKYYQESADFSSISLELSDTYGPNDVRKKIINLLIDASRRKETLIMSPGEQRLEFLYIDDVVSAFLRAMEILENNSEKHYHKKYYIGTDEDVSLRELVSIFNEVSTEKVKAVFGGRSYRPREIMNPIKFGDRLPGWEAKVGLKAGLQKILNC